MESSSEGDEKNQSGGLNESGENQGKPKRKMKTPFQLETLEKAYAAEPYPIESARIELSERLGLTDRQLQMWFCHRRLKDKKGFPVKKLPVAMNVPEVGNLGKAKLEAGGSEPGSRSGPVSSGSDSGEQHKFTSKHARDAGAAARDGGSGMKRRYESLQSIMELRAIAAVEEQLGEPLREDGPILGMEFDQLPPDAFGLPIATAQQMKGPDSYDNKFHDQSGPSSKKESMRFLHERNYKPSSRLDPYGLPPMNQLYDSPNEVKAKPSSLMYNDELSMGYGLQAHLTDARPSSQKHKQAHTLASPATDKEFFSRREPYSNIKMEDPSSGHAITSAEHSHGSFDRNSPRDDDVIRMERKRKVDEVKNPRGGESQEKRIRRELEKQDLMRRKMEEQMKKEMEKQDRERRKEEERLMRERLREEERLMREQKREMERRERFLQKESLKAEKRRQKEDLRREREAVRQKAAIEKASARKIARESMELIDDERLELMELAAVSKGVSSITSLDHDTLKNIDYFRDSLRSFPPMSVQTKNPFAVSPWNNSDANIGDLLMAWRFFIDFADALELSPFTLDEFVQAFHDYDSRLLGEVNIALLKLIVKDIEDVARTPSMGSGLNPGGSVNPEGGHPQIVEGAYAWGFSIRTWQSHLNPLTWPEILRQMALSAGFGPKLKKKSFKKAYLCDNIEGKGAEGADHVISTLRNGSAAENAVALMQEKGFSVPRKSRHRLAPGTVKFAAFHVLSLEGNKGLIISELAEKIQKSGLRDLRTSKTPEASIGVALSRDTKLFERIAPSTYRVRTAFRKDPADAEAILASAREKLRALENGFIPRVYADCVEKDLDSDCDLPEGPEMDILSTPSERNHKVDLLSTPSDKNKDIIYFDEEINILGDSKENLCSETVVQLQNEHQKDSAALLQSSYRDVNNSDSGINQYVSGVEGTPRITEQEIIEIDESLPGETWVQGLTNSEYCELTVEERLNALVALIGISNEGNTIRAVLEDRLEGANALRKQMWADVQLDKRRLKDEYLSKFTPIGGKAETEVMSFAAPEGIKSPLPVFGIKDETSLYEITNQKSHIAPDISTGQDNFPSEQQKCAAERSLAQLKSYITHKAEEMSVYRSLPLGQDRRRNRYWQFVASASRNDPGAGRIFIELHDGHWVLIDTAEAFDDLLNSLDTRGIREAHLNVMLKDIEPTFKGSLRRSSEVLTKSETVENEAHMVTDSVNCTSSTHKMNYGKPEISSSFRIELGMDGTEKAAAWERYQDFQKWAWKECVNEFTLCAIKYGKERCEPLLGHIHDSYSCPVGPRLIKTLSALIEVCIPLEAVHSFWTEVHKNTWGMKLQKMSSMEDFLKTLTLLEFTMKRDFLSSSFETTQELLRLGSYDPTTAGDSLKLVPELPWIPHTCAAVGLRLLELDAAIFYAPEQKVESNEHNSVPEFSKFPSRCDMLQKQEAELTELGYNHWIENPAAASGRNVSKGTRGSAGRGRGRANVESRQRRVSSYKSKSNSQTSKTHHNPDTGFRQSEEEWSGWGRRIVRGRRTKKNIVREQLPIEREAAPMETGNYGEFRMKHAMAADDSDSGESVESDDENAQVTRADDVGWHNSYDNRSDERIMYHNREPSYEEMDGFGQEMDSEEDEDENPDEDVMDDGMDGKNINRAGPREDGGFQLSYSDDDDDSE